MSEHPIDRLFQQVDQRRDASPAHSYTAKLLQEGIAKCAKKLGEEGVETALAAVSGDKRAVVLESADLLYHLMVVWAASGVSPQDVYDELTAREGRSGLDVKAARKASGH